MWRADERREESPPTGAWHSGGPVTDVQGHHLTRRGIHGAPQPRLAPVLLHNAAHVIGFHLQASDHDVAMTGGRLDVEMLRQGLEALDEKPQKPLECHPHRATHTASGNPFHQQAFDERPLVPRDQVLFEAPNELAST